MFAHVDRFAGRSVLLKTLLNPSQTACKPHTRAPIAVSRIIGDNMHLFFDTETTGSPRTTKRPFHLKNWPDWSRSFG
jgi:hypothetical protein